jgi:hypothetical protein
LAKLHSLQRLWPAFLGPPLPQRPSAACVCGVGEEGGVHSVQRLSPGAPRDMAHVQATTYSPNASVSGGNKEALSSALDGRRLGNQAICLPPSLCSQILHSHYGHTGWSHTSPQGTRTLTTVPSTVSTTISRLLSGLMTESMTASGGHLLPSHFPE